MRSAIVAIAIGLLAVAPPVAAKGAEPFRVQDGHPIGRSSVLNGPNGVNVGPDGKVYVASVRGDEITVHDPRTGAILDRIGPEQGVHGPDDVVVGPDGTIYWTELLAGNVGLLRPEQPTVLRQLNRIDALTRDFLSDGLYELDPALVAPPRVMIADLVGFNGMDFGPDGMLYGALFFSGAVARVDVDAAVPAAQIVATGFRVPRAVAFNTPSGPSG